MAKSKKDPKVIDTNNGAVIVNTSWKQIIALCAFAIFLTGWAVVYKTESDGRGRRLAELEKKIERKFEVSELPGFVEDAVKEHLDKNNIISNMLDSYNCPELFDHIDDVKSVINIKDCK